MMKKLIVFLVFVLACTLLLASCGGDTCYHENIEGGVCVDCGKSFGTTYTFNFVSPDGTTTQTVLNSDKLVEPTMPTVPEGYEFNGWWIDDSGSFDFNSPAYVYTDRYAVNGTVTVTARIEPKTWSITYVNPFNEGDIAGGNPRKYQTGQTVEIKNENVFGYGYDFVGWFFDEELTQPATVITGKMEDITLYAKAYYLPFATVTELDDGSVELSGLRPSYGPWVEGGENTLIIPETYGGKRISSVSVSANYLTHLVIESNYCTVKNIPGSVKSIQVSDDHEIYKYVDGSLYSKDGTILYVFLPARNTMHAEIPEGVTTIADGAVIAAYDASVSYKSLTLPTTLTTIEANFYYAEILEIYNLSSHITVTAGSNDNGQIAKHALAVHTDRNAKSILDEKDGFVFLETDDVKYLIAYVGTDTVVSLPDTSIYDIYEYAFRNTNITEITVSAGVRKIEHGAFPASLQKITFEGAGLELLGTPFQWTNASGKEVHVKSIEQWLTFTFEGGGSNPFCNNNAGLYIDGVLVTDVVIPDGASIPAYAFYDYQHLNSVTVGEGVTVIPLYAFSKSSIVTLVISNGVQEIKSGAFGDCEKLAEVELPSSLVSLGADAFYGSATLIEVADDGAKYVGNWLVGASSDLIGDTLTIREGTVGIANDSIAHNGIKTVIIPASVKYLGSRAITAREIDTIYYNAVDAVVNGTGCFYQTGMNSAGITVYIGAGVRSIPANLFGGDRASGLLYGTYAANVKVVEFLGNAVKSIGDRAFANAIYLESIVLPDSLESIGQGAFVGCSALKSINIPKNVKSIAGSAFNTCYALESIYYYAKDADVEASSSSALFGGAGSNASACVLTVGREVTSIPAYAFYSASLTSVIVETDSVLTVIEESAFQNNGRLVSIDLADSVDTLGKYSFAYCSSLAEINGSGLAYVDEKAIYESRNMPDDWGCEVYGNINYYFKTALSPVSNNITWARFKSGSVIPDGFFQYCLQLQHVYIAKGSQVGDEMFRINSFSNISKRLTLRVFFEDNDYEGTSAWRRVITHEGTEYNLSMVVSVNGENTTLGKTQFSVPITSDGFAYSVDTRSTPPTATILGYFANADSLTIGGMIGEYLIYDVADYAFYMHDGINFVVVDAYEIGDMSFAASSIYSITLSGVDDVATGAFLGCVKLHDATLSDVEEIGAYAFNGCTSLAWIDISSDSNSNFFIRDYAFAGCASLTEITLPINTYTIATGAFLESGITKVYTSASEWYIIADAAGTNPDIISTYTVSTPEALASALVTTYNNYYWANKAYM